LLEERAGGPADESSAGERSQSPLSADKGFWIAVLPFGHRGADPEVETLADGLAEEIVIGLSRFSYLRVIARSSTARYSDAPSDVRAVGQQLGARYVMQGSVRQAGPRARIAAQLVDTITGANLWAETYERDFSAESVFGLLDDVAPRIVATVADMNGVLPHAMSELLRGRDPATLTPYEAVLRSFGYLARLDAAEHGLVREALERAVEKSPLDADCWAMLSFVYAEEFKHGFNVRDGSLDRALDAARRAVAAAPANALCYHMLAQALFFRRDLVAFRNGAERAIELNPMDACTLAFMGILLGYAGDWERGCGLAEQAMQLNPHHPGWYRFAAFNAAYSRRDFDGALGVALKFNMPSYFYTHYALAAAYGQLGELEAARRALEELLAQRPDFADVAREELARWYGHGDVLELALDGLRKAGLSIPD
jgi:TolB-like protein/Tfp pilus assembly protein PilF